MGLAYAIASFTQGIATFVIPATGRGIGLDRAMEGFVILASICMAVVVFREPRVLPGRGAAAPVH